MRLSDGTDPITAFATHDWAAAGGWSLFIGLAMLNVVGFFREYVVPGARARRTEAALDKALETVQQQSRQIDRLTVTSELVGNLLSEATPHKGTLGSSHEGHTS